MFLYAAPIWPLLLHDRALTGTCGWGCSKPSQFQWRKFILKLLYFQTRPLQTGEAPPIVMSESSKVILSTMLHREQNTCSLNLQLIAFCFYLHFEQRPNFFRTACCEVWDEPQNMNTYFKRQTDPPGPVSAFLPKS